MKSNNRIQPTPGICGGFLHIFWRRRLMHDVSIKNGLRDINVKGNTFFTDSQTQTLGEPIMKRPQSLTAKLKVCDQEIILYVTALEKENLKLQKQIAILQVKDVSQQNKITALEKAQPKMIVRVTSFAKGDDNNKK